LVVNAVLGYRVLAPTAFSKWESEHDGKVSCP
jgi:hypothetical protein